MQDKYVSLDPEFHKERQAIFDTNRVLKLRLEEAHGGPAAVSLGYLIGFTGALFMYNRQAKSGFALFPLQRNKLPQYAILFATYFVFNRFGKAFVSTVTGDADQLNYLSSNWRGIIN